MCGKIWFALFAVFVLGVVTAQLNGDCDEDPCKGVVNCPSVRPCNGRYFDNGGEPCGCCPVCIKVESNVILGVGVGQRCGPPTYLSCQSNLECRRGVCQYPADILVRIETEKTTTPA